MPHRALTATEMAAAQKLFDVIMSPANGGPAPERDEAMDDYTIRVWEKCAAAVIEPAGGAALGD